MLDDGTFLGRQPTDRFHSVSVVVGKGDWELGGCGVIWENVNRHFFGNTGLMLMLLPVFVGVPVCQHHDS